MDHQVGQELVVAVGGEGGSDAHVGEGDGMDGLQHEEKKNLIPQTAQSKFFFVGLLGWIQCQIFPSNFL